MYICSMVLALLLIISIVGLFYYELINEHFESIYKEKYHEYKNAKLTQV